ncbi:hypothetical protein KCP73_25675 [Salmonella enterica subsp. enterica]|nr:hypothetical protein KCP73_25675 [Salmonella enterica subsp. enterica]
MRPKLSGGGIPQSDTDRIGSATGNGILKFFVSLMKSRHGIGEGERSC